MADEYRYLNLLSIFHFLVAGIAGLFACIPIIHLAYGITVVNDMPLFQSPDMVSKDMFSPYSLIPLLFIILPAAFIALGWTFAIALALTGYFIRKRQWHTFCLVIGGIETIFTPFGTVLGVFTIILLTKPSVKALFISEENDK